MSYAKESARQFEVLDSGCLNVEDAKHILIGLS